MAVPRLTALRRWPHWPANHGRVDESGVPEHVEAAIDDACALTIEAFRDDPDADLRTEVIPTFYQQVVGFHCAYRT